MNNQWISVKERLPEYKFHVGGSLAVNVLVSDGRMVGEGDFTNGDFYFCGVKHPHITHWMPLPEPPRGDK